MVLYPPPPKKKLSNDTFESGDSRMNSLFFLSIFRLCLLVFFAIPISFLPIADPYVDHCIIQKSVRTVLPEKSYNISGCGSFFEINNAISVTIQHVMSTIVGKKTLFS